VPRVLEIRRIAFHSVIPTLFPAGPDSGIWGREAAVQKGETLLITGVSGSGKTSLLFFAAGFRSEYGGRIEWDGRDVARLSDGERSAARVRQIAAVFQDLKLIQGLTARENIEVKRRLAAYRSATEAEAMAERLGIGRVLGERVESLSRGEQQRVAVIRALVQPFSFLFLDEPFSHLDAAAAREARTLIEQERAARGAGLVLLDLEDASVFPAARRLTL
jgi:ABC-type lipoprotein export system ATPase subunit